MSNSINQRSVESPSNSSAEDPLFINHTEPVILDKGSANVHKGKGNKGKGTKPSQIALPIMDTKLQQNLWVDYAGRPVMESHVQPFKGQIEIRTLTGTLYLRGLIFCESVNTSMGQIIRYQMEKLDRFSMNRYVMFRLNKILIRCFKLVRRREFLIQQQDILLQQVNRDQEYKIFLLYNRHRLIHKFRQVYLLESYHRCQLCNRIQKVKRQNKLEHYHLRRIHEKLQVVAVCKVLELLDHMK